MQNEFIERFRTALRIKTDWPGEAQTTETEANLKRFQDFLVDSFPAFNKSAERTVLSPYSVIYRWPGTAGGNGKTNPADKAPVLFIGHYDVVPAETAKWSVDPFGAELKDGYVYARGVLDMKHIVVSIMEGAEDLCKQGFKPGRDVWFAFGGDEELTGLKGAKEAANWFLRKGIKFSFIMDEGTPVVKDQLKGIDVPLALVGIEEKGYLSLDLTVNQKPGHASQPPEEQAVAILSRALLRISQRPFPWHLTSAVEAFFGQLSLHAPGVLGFAMKHSRLLGPLFFKAAAVSPSTRAMLRTTVAMTQLEGSAADNVMPSAARAVINLRLLPPWTVETAIERIKTVIADSRVGVAVNGLGTNPVEAGPEQAAQKSPGWKEINAALGKAFPGIPVLPFLMVATTDSRHYLEQSRNIFRFNPLLLDPDELSLVHGHDERVSVENMEKCLSFYTALIEQL